MVTMAGDRQSRLHQRLHQFKELLQMDWFSDTAVGVLIFAPQEGQRLLTISQYAQVDRLLALLKRLFH